MARRAVKRSAAGFVRGVRVPFTDPSGGKGFWAAFSRAPAHRHVRYRAALPGWRGRDVTVVFLSDLHLGSHAGDVGRLAAIGAEVRALAPDLVLLGGDHMNMMTFGGGRIPPEAIAAELAGWSLPMATVLGNHDLEYGAEAVAAAFETAGIPVLENRTAHFAIGADVLRVVGLADDMHGEPDLGLVAAAAGAELVLSHDPGIIYDLPEGAVLLAGHIHAGQVRLPGLPPLRMPPSRIPRALAHGHHRVGRRHLIVSAGLGCSALPLRLFAPPEVVTVVLVAEAA
ncbi:putative metallophosphoesterase [bacterium YEK0313]|nr:putative metallophosphoesterase [bacterium YEK0313]